MFARKNKYEGINLLDLKPIRSFEYVIQDDNKVTLLIPKFRDKILGKYLQTIIKKKYYKVKLDTLGSFVWLKCDGQTTVREIATKLKDVFGDAAEPAYDRVATFIQQLYRGDCITFNR